MTTTPVLSTIIVNWNTRALLLECLSSFYASVPVPAEVILVDNGSTDGSTVEVRKQYPDVHILENPTNLGFARAVNQALTIARGKYCLVLNSDTKLTTDAVDNLLKFLQKHPQAGLVGAQFINEDGSPQHSFDNFPNLLSELTNKSLLRLIAPNKYPSKKQIHQSPLEVESLVGAAMMVRATTIKSVGFLDEDYFVFLEETDWCWRMKQKGWQVFYLPSARICHYQGATKKEVLIPAKIEYLNSLYKFFKKNRSRISYFLLRVSRPLKLLLELLLTLCACILTAFIARPLRKRFRVLFNLVLWHVLLCPESMTLKGKRYQLKHESTLNPDNTSLAAANDTIKIKWLFQGMTFKPLADNLCFSKELKPQGNNLSVETIKELRNKRLYRLKWNAVQEAYLIKLYLNHAHPFEYIKNFLSGPKSLRESKLAHKTLARGILTIVPLAVGYTQTPAGQPQYNFFITRELSNCWNLHSFLLEPRNIPSDFLTIAPRELVLQAYGRFARKIHDRGILLDDFEPNNILIQFVAGGKFHLVLVDFERAHFHHQLSFKQRIWSLAKLNRIDNRLSLKDRLRFIRSYLNTNNKSILRTWITPLRLAQSRLLWKDYLWAKKISLIPSRNIGYYDSDPFAGYYRRHFPQLNRQGLTSIEVNQIAEELRGLVNKDTHTLSGTLNTLNLHFKILTNYIQAKKLWQELNALMTRYTTPAVPFLVLKHKTTKQGIIVSEQLKNHSLPKLHPSRRNSELEERLTALKNVGI